LNLAFPSPLIGRNRTWLLGLVLCMLTAGAFVHGALAYVTNQGAKVSTAGATGKSILVKGATRKEVVLQPSGENAMESNAQHK
jgi:hypothetical protein